MTGAIRIERDGGIATLVIDNEEKRNALTLAMSIDATTRLRELEADPNVRVVVVTGVGEKSFCSGADLSEFEALRSDAESSRRYTTDAGALYSTLESLAKPTIARIRGSCFGGGVILAACCDLRIASSDASFAITAAKLGNGFTFDFTRRLVDLVGPARAKEILFTAARLTAAEAAARGLVERVVPTAEFDAAASAWAAEIAGNAPLALKAIKTNVAEALRPAAERDVARIELQIDACAASEDFREGRAAFRERRAPRFRGF